MSFFLSTVDICLQVVWISIHELRVGQISLYVVSISHMYERFRSVVVITLASHARGPGFDPQRNQNFSHFIQIYSQKQRKKWKGTSLGGLEPPTFRLTAERANRLRHRDDWLSPIHSRIWENRHGHWNREAMTFVRWHVGWQDRIRCSFSTVSVRIFNEQSII